ncbi:hypothetical protein C0J26_01875 [Pseudomonas baetica]|nr:hypothetical protein C0J26_01875 [Pseudomonas baetica]
MQHRTDASVGLTWHTSRDHSGAKIPCGSEPAREDVVSVAISVNDPAHSRAGSLPQWICVTS